MAASQVFDDTVDLAKQARFAMEFSQQIESCGKCTPCRIGSTRGVEVLDPHHRRTMDRGENLRILDDLLRTPCSTDRSARWAA